MGPPALYYFSPIFKISSMVQIQLYFHLSKLARCCADRPTKLDYFISCTFDSYIQKSNANARQCMLMVRQKNQIRKEKELSSFTLCWVWEMKKKNRSVSYAQTRIMRRSLFFVFFWLQRVKRLNHAVLICLVLTYAYG